MRHSGGSNLLFKLAAFSLASVASACEAPRGPDVGTDDQDGPRRDPLAVLFPIVFSSVRGGNYDLHVTTPDGGVTRRITNGGDFWVPRWSPDGKTIVCRQQVDGPDGVNAEVVVVSVETGGVVPLTQGEDSNQFLLPANWSVEGTEVAYASLATGEDAASRRLWSVPWSGGPPSRVFPGVELAQRELAWSLPDGRYLAYTEGPDAELWLSDTFEGGPATNISAGHVHNPIQIAWSRDGSRIAMTAYALDAEGNVEGLADHLAGRAPPPDSEIFVFDVTSGEFTRITDNTFSDYAPAWSPDGTALLVTSDRDSVVDLDVWLLPLDAPDEALNLIDDNDDPHEDGLAHWFPGLP
jgi:Tol biopolymer transport system component